MFEYPEIQTLARQMAAELPGRRVTACDRGSAEHKWVFANVGPEVFAELPVGRTIGPIAAVGKCLVLPLEPDQTLLIGETGGRVQLHPAGAPTPPKYHLRLAFDDCRQLVITVQAWGFFQLGATAEALAKPLLAGVPPTVEALTPAAWQAIVADCADRARQPLKAFIVQRPKIAGMGNGYFSDILFTARLHPKRRLGELTDDEHERLRRGLIEVMANATAGGGRDTERDLYGRPGGYRTLLDRRRLGQPCPHCGVAVGKLAQLGGSVYFCPGCQRC